ncbi:MAG: hypothetical protein I8H75_03375 [Myxococcaceae bacterium]|nr:hypothetical protein [Myxococcaceae bacterium]MBH2006370.1 hypothetical protein [Myxococcaceae bacterium]
MEYLHNVTASEVGKIRSSFLSGMLTLMLCINAVAISVAVGILDDQLPYPINLGIAISVFSCAGSIFLFFLINRYLETITYRFYRIYFAQIETIIVTAKRFFWPFLIAILMDALLACLGLGVLLSCLAIDQGWFRL